MDSRRVGEILAAVESKDAQRTCTPKDKRGFIADLPPKAQESTEQVVATADTEVLKGALLATLVILLVALPLSVFLSARTEASEVRSSTTDCPGEK
ncbi:MAG: hypothetical protein ACYSUI_08615 [Planctomycetota bacterium]